jgi:arsenate reductase
VKSDRLYSYVITVCDQSAAERCPIFAGITQRLDWSFPDPATLSGTDDEKMIEVRKIRDAIRARIVQWAATLKKQP